MTEGTLLEALRALAHELVARLDADASIISRVLGDVLIVVTQTAADDDLGLGQGFLVSDYPLTKRVLDSGEPTMLTLDDADVDPAEAELLQALGYATLLMLPFELRGTRWGLVEVYRTHVRPFTPDEIKTAAALARI